MEPIKRLSDLPLFLQEGGLSATMAVAWAQDPHTIEAVVQAARAGIARIRLLGNPQTIATLLEEHQAGDLPGLEILDAPDAQTAIARAVAMVRSGEAQVLMKGLVNTDDFLRHVLAREGGLMKPKSTLTYACAMDIPSHPKLFLISDPAVLPFPSLEQKLEMLGHLVGLAHDLGIEEPRVAIVAASEKVSGALPSTMDAATLCTWARRGRWPGAIVDGPLDIFAALTPDGAEIKGIQTPIHGDADALLFPSLDSCNTFYKGLLALTGGHLAGLLQGTTHPVVVMSRSEDPLSKFYCIALAVLQANRS